MATGAASFKRLLGSGDTSSDVPTVWTDTRRASNVGAIWRDRDGIVSTDILPIRCDPWSSCDILAVRSESNGSAISDISAIRTKPRGTIDVRTVRCKRWSFHGVLLITQAVKRTACDAIRSHAAGIKRTHHAPIRPLETVATFEAEPRTAGERSGAHAEQAMGLLRGPARRVRGRVVKPERGHRCCLTPCVR